MEFREMLLAAETKCGSVRALATQIGEKDSNISAAKRGVRGIPDEACALLAKILNLDYGQVSAARNAALAKDEKQREFWRPFVERRAAAWLVAIATNAFFGIAAPNDAHANDTFNVSEATPRLAPLSQTDVCGMYIMSNSLSRALIE